MNENKQDCNERSPNELPALGVPGLGTIQQWFLLRPSHPLAAAGAYLHTLQTAPGPISRG